MLVDPNTQKIFSYGMVSFLLQCYSPSGRLASYLRQYKLCMVHDNYITTVPGAYSKVISLIIALYGAICEGFKKQRD